MPTAAVGGAVPRRPPPGRRRVPVRVGFVDLHVLVARRSELDPERGLGVVDARAARDRDQMVLVATQAGLSYSAHGTCSRPLRLELLLRARVARRLAAGRCAFATSGRVDGFACHSKMPLAGTCIVRVQVVRERQALLTTSACRTSSSDAGSPRRVHARRAPSACSCRRCSAGPCSRPRGCRRRSRRPSCRSTPPPSPRTAGGSRGRRSRT